MKRNKEAAKIAKHISEFLNDYAPMFLTNSEHTLKSYKDALTLYITFLENEGVTPNHFSRHYFEKNFIEKWIKWLKEERHSCSDTCNVRLGSLRVFLRYLGEQNIELMYLYQEAKNIKRQKCVKKKVAGLTRDAVKAILNTPDATTKTGKRDLVFLTILYSTAGRLDEIRSIKVSDLNLDKQNPYVIIHGKGDKLRTAYLLPRAVEYIKVYLKDFHGLKPTMDAYLFYSRVGGKHCKLTEQALDKRIKIYAKIANETCQDVPLNAHAHQFRHAKASHWLEDGINVVQINYLLGHEHLNTTMKYLDITTEEKLKALATLETEIEKTKDKKWKNVDGTLVEFCGLTR
ncbi:MAG: tyrosine-type recombinase/integrase [Clostridiales bacterium]|nr:tyrosine-type recombinase/integrase [Clostridiales bacterium]